MQRSENINIGYYNLGLDPQLQPENSKVIIRGGIPITVGKDEIIFGSGEPLFGERYFPDQLVPKGNGTKHTNRAPTPTLKDIPPVITLFRRGIKLVPPLETQENMRLIQDGFKGKVQWSLEEKVRLRQIMTCPILERRYPTHEEGQRFMERVDPDRRNELYGLAVDLTEHIVSSWKRINPDKDIAVILYGSIAKGLVKKKDDPDPSNVDLAVLGDFTEEEREKLFDEIRCRRQEIGEILTKECTLIAEDNRGVKGGNAGVNIQNIEKLTKSKYGEVIKYVRSCAFALYDPANIWANLENEALGLHIAEQKRRENHAKKKQPHPVFQAQ